MSRHLRVVMDDTELDEIRAAAERRRMNVSEWVRLVVLWGAARHEPSGLSRQPGQGLGPQYFRTSLPHESRPMCGL